PTHCRKCNGLVRSPCGTAALGCARAPHNYHCIAAPSETMTIERRMSECAHPCSRYPALMTRAALDYVLWDMGQAFDMLFANLKDLRDDDWAWVPDGAVRSIRAIVVHVASCKIMYYNHALRDGTMTWKRQRDEEAQTTHDC